MFQVRTRRLSTDFNLWASLSPIRSAQGVHCSTLVGRRADLSRWQPRRFPGVAEYPPAGLRVPVQPAARVAGSAASRRSCCKYASAIEREARFRGHAAGMFEGATGRAPGGRKMLARRAGAKCWRAGRARRRGGGGIGPPGSAARRTGGGALGLRRCRRFPRRGAAATARRSRSAAASPAGSRRHASLPPGCCGRRGTAGAGIPPAAPAPGVPAAR